MAQLPPTYGVPQHGYAPNQQYSYPPVGQPYGPPPTYGPAHAVWVPPQPIPGLPMKAPRVAPFGGQTLIAYEITEPEVGCCQCSDLNSQGIIAMIILLVMFWPLAWLPCVMTECHQKSQRPVYGFPPGQAMPMPEGQPKYGA